MRRRLSCVCLICLCYCVVGCSHVKNATSSVYSKVNGWFGDEKNSEEQEPSNSMVCVLNPTDAGAHDVTNPAAPKAKGPSIYVPEPAHDFGEIRQEGVLVHDFKVKNTGTKALKIKSIKPG